MAKILNYTVALPLTVSQVTMFITYLHVFHKLRASTVRSYLSGISFVHNFKGLPDPASAWTVLKVMKQISKKDCSHDSRLPITRDLLLKLVQIVTSLYLNKHDIILYRAMFLLAWHACLRVSEFTWSKNNEHCLTMSNIRKHFNNVEGLNCYRIVFTSFKHKHGHYPELSIDPYPQDIRLCPYAALTSYLKIRGTTEGPLFLWSSGTPVSRSAFTRVLKNCITVVEPTLQHYGTHSFRVGRATQALEDNMPITKLVLLGRWKSGAVHGYCRPSVVSVV